MEPRMPIWDPQAEEPDKKLRELALKWFTETQAPLLLHNHNFPTWFQGFITRKDAEESLRAKELGCFLIRLSDKAIGYILSYKGRDRCRHFVINQTRSGQFIVSGDIEVHDTLTDLIEFYKMRPIEPFGEYLTYSCLEPPAEDLYDFVGVTQSEKPAVSVKAVMRMWDQWSDRTPEQPPTLPPKSGRSPKKFPLVAQKDSHLKSGSLDEQNSDQGKVLYAQLNKHPARAQISSFESLHRDPQGSGLVPAQPASLYSELNLVDCRSKSLPLLDVTSEEEDSARVNGSLTPPTQLLKTPRQAAYPSLSLFEQRETSSRPPAIPTSHSPDDQLSSSPVYHLAGGPAHQLTAEDNGATMSAEEDDSLYAEVPSGPVPRHFLQDNTYEQIPEHRLRMEASRRPEHDSNNTYESLEELKQHASKNSHSSWGIKTDKWRLWLFPESKKK
ncbi:SH2 domain-containing protein 7 [Aplochiton taeniatus]